MRINREYRPIENYSQVRDRENMNRITENRENRSSELSQLVEENEASAQKENRVANGENIAVEKTNGEKENNVDENNMSQTGKSEGTDVEANVENRNSRSPYELRS